MKQITEQLMTVLMADDDPDDCMLVREAFDECRIGCNLRFVDDGPSLLDYLYQRNPYDDPADSPRPHLILLDLNMPKKDGREILKVIKKNKVFSAIPVVVLTTSMEEADVMLAYKSGAASYVIKPGDFEGLTDFVRRLGDYWLGCVRLPFFYEDGSLMTENEPDAGGAGQ
ncbi:MAG: response regulator [Thermodesulfobacteriota bacterium]|nr:response regulator [Thermodesulfobacteriota bacterium]